MYSIYYNKLYPVGDMILSKQKNKDVPLERLPAASAQFSFSGI